MCDWSFSPGSVHLNGVKTLLVGISTRKFVSFGFLCFLKFLVCRFLMEKESEVETMIIMDFCFCVKIFNLRVSPSIGFRRKLTLSDFVTEGFFDFR